MQSESRTAKWDNLKFILIYLVVLGHMLYPFRNESELVKGLYLFIYLFHMPLFIFVSGMFSKTIIRKRQWERVISYLLLYNFIRALDTLGTYAHKGKLELNFFETNGPDWYAMSVFIFLIITIIFQEVKPVYLLAAALMVGLIAGCTDVPGSLLSYMRSCVFYPFFLLGFYTDRKRLENFGRLDIRMIAGIVVIGLLIFFIAKGADYYSYIHLFKAKRAYDEMGVEEYQGILLRGMQYIAAFGVGLMVLLAIPDEKSVFSDIGKRTLPVFVWHYLFLKIFWGFSGKNVVMSLFPDTYLVVLILMCMLLILFCSSHLFDKTLLLTGGLNMNMPASFLHVSRHHRIWTRTVNRNGKIGKKGVNGREIRDDQD